ncbi:MAG: DUF6489 family protein [Candidatus Eiseniibacteriota bacterium]
MKVTINIDCSPEEARTFFGLPDVKGVQDEMMKQVVDRMKGGFTDKDIADMVKMMMSGVQGVEQFQKMFWAQFTGTGAKGTK